LQPSHNHRCKKNVFVISASEVATLRRYTNLFIIIIIIIKNAKKNFKNVAKILKKVVNVIKKTLPLLTA